jgi:hypothetical protein
MDTISNEILINDKQNNKFEALKYRHQDQVQDMTFHINLANRLFYGFMGLQLAFGSFVSQVKNIEYKTSIVLFLLDMFFGLLCFWLLYTNEDKRKKIKENIKNCNKAMGFADAGIYLDNLNLDFPISDFNQAQVNPGTSSTVKKANSNFFLKDKEGRYRWLWQYTLGIIITVAAIGLLLLTNKAKEAIVNDNKKYIKIVVNKDTLIVVQDSLLLINLNAETNIPEVTTPSTIKTITKTRKK